MEHKQIIIGDYVFTPCKNVFNNKVSYWISKRDYTISFHVFTPLDQKDLEYHTREKSLNAYIDYFETRIKAIFV